jgi:hypothetical protein
LDDFGRCRSRLLHPRRLRKPRSATATYYDCGEPTPAITLTALGQNITYKTVYSWIVDCIICALVPFLFLVYLNVRLVLEIRKSTRYPVYMT